MGVLRTSLTLLLLPLLTACGSNDPIVNIPPQKWQNTDIHIETRPSPPQKGMNEIIVIATGERGRPAYDLVIDLRTNDNDDWKQAIEDGQVGVYRRAVAIDAESRSTLQVQIRRGAGEASVLQFPLQIAP
jgi:hypothetical protein